MRPTFQESKVAFVILTWNSERFVRSCIKSVLELSAARIDIYVEDNGSEDGTVAMLEDLSIGEDRLHIECLLENKGTTIPRNRALSRIAADTDYICILDSDTKVNQRALDEMTSVLVTDHSIGVVGPTMSDSKGVIQLSGRELPTLGIKLGKAFPFGGFAAKAHERERPCAPVMPNGVQDVGYLISACWLMPYQTYCCVGALDEGIYYAPEDVDWCLRCWKAGLRVVWDHNARILHEYQRIGHKKLFCKTNLEHIKGLVHYFNKHGYLLHAPTLPSQLGGCQGKGGDRSGKKRIAYYAEGWGNGGIERFIFNVASALDPLGFSFDIFTVHTWNPAYDEEIKGLGGARFTIFDGHTPGLVVRTIKGLRAWDSHLDHGCYDIVHINAMNGMAFVYAWIARKHDVALRVVHSHNTDFGGGHRMVKSVIHKMGGFLFSSAANVRLACNREAGEYLFGRRSFEVLRNGVDVGRFHYDEVARKCMRDDLGLNSNTILFGNVGRLAEAKNPLFLVEVLVACVHCGVDADLLLVGDGPLFQDVRSLAAELKVEDRVLTPGATSEPEKYLSALDVFTLPSRYEGAPMAIYEAVACGLPLILSDTQPSLGLSVPYERRLSVENPETWRDEILSSASFSGKASFRSAGVQCVCQAGYDVVSSLDPLLRLYNSGARRER